jgi:hypothetical protein
MDTSATVGRCIGVVVAVHVQVQILNGWMSTRVDIDAESL